MVQTAVGDPRVAQAWNEPSILEFQTVGSLASHLARGGVWAVAEYLDAEPPSPDTANAIETAAEYFASIDLSPEDHAAVRQRGATIAQDGPEVVNDRLAEGVEGLRRRLADEPEDRRVTVYGGMVMPLDDYLWTRIVEQVVHLDDLARSLQIDPWPNAADAAALVVSCGAEIGRRRFGDARMIRALFRPDPDSTLRLI